MCVQRSFSLDGYEIVFICDDSSSMNHRWNRYRRPTGPVRYRHRFQTGRSAGRSVDRSATGRPVESGVPATDRSI